MVFDLSFGTDTSLPDNVNVGLHTRGATGFGNSSFNAYTIVNNKFVESTYTTRCDGVTDEDLTIVPGEWNQLATVLYIDETYEAPKGTGHGIQYWFLNGKMIGYTSQASGDGCSESSFNVLGMRWDFPKNLTIGDSLFYDNLGARFYTAPIAEGETLGTIAGDDTVFIAVRSEAFAKEISERIRSMSNTK